MGHPIGEAADIWALGCMLYLISYGALPFTGESQLEVMAGKSSFPQTRPPAFGRLAAALLNIEPNRRPDINAVLQMVGEMKQTTTPSLNQLSGVNQPVVENRSNSATVKLGFQSIRRSVDPVEERKQMAAESGLTSMPNSARGRPKDPGFAPITSQGSLTNSTKSSQPSRPPMVEGKAENPAEITVSTAGEGKKELPRPSIAQKPSTPQPLGSIRGQDPEDNVQYIEEIKSLK